MYLINANMYIRAFVRTHRAHINIMKNTIPIFPEFRPFTFDDISWYCDFYHDNGLSPYADISPDDLFVWLNYNEDLIISKINNAIILQYTNTLDNNKINIIPLGRPLKDNTVEQVMRYLTEKKLPEVIREVPSVLCCNLDEKKWSILEDRDSYEYILDTREQSSLGGSDFSRQRRRINYFEREHSCDKIDVQLHKDINDDIKELFFQYINSMPFNSSQNSSNQNLTEPAAIKRNLEYATAFRKQVLVIKINDKVASLSLISCLDDDTVAINHLKVDYSIQYIFQYTIYRLAKIFDETGIKEMNIEQDLGVEGIRIFKERLQPSHFLKKKIICSRHQ